MNRILIHHNRKKDTMIVKKKLMKLLRENGFILTRENPELIIVIGGDGTMLSAIRRYRLKRIPFLGVNTGTLGFLPSVPPQKPELIIEILKSGDYKLQSYPLMKVQATTVNGDTISSYAFNEILIKHLEPRLMEARMYINEKPFNYFTGDGFILSTPIGATGYAIWAGGVATHSELPVYQITPLNPNDNSVNRPLKASMVVPIDTVLDFKIVKAERREVIVACDGIRVSNDYISDLHVRASDREVHILRWGDYDYFELYRNKIIDKNVNRVIF